MDSIVHSAVRLQLLVGNLDDVVAVHARLDHAIGILTETGVHVCQPVSKVIGVTHGVIGIGL